MTHPRDYLPVLDRIGVALEATCDALMTLESIDVLPGMDEDAHTEGHVAQAVSHLQHAIQELREAQVRGQTGLALGFVLAQGRRTTAGPINRARGEPRR
jgi:hypothetical protein